ncbi:MAG: O-antigen ligase family protein [Bacteroidales bacterium]|nr:O-antigen ligase family protein [Bacteroidales bacterium]
MPVTWNQFLRYWYIFSLCVTIASLPFSKLGISIGQFMLVGGWIAERYDGRRLISALAGSPPLQSALNILPLSLGLLYKAIENGFRQFSRNRPALIFSSILLFHVLGLIFTTDFNYAFKDLRTKLPFFLVPLVISTSESFDKKGFYRIMLLFVLAVLIRSFYNTWMIATHHFLDIRDVSRNISHIIYSLLLTLSIFTLIFFLFKRKVFVAWQKGIILLILVWLCAYIIISQSFTGLSIAMITILILIPVLIFKTRNQWLKAILVLSTLILITGIGFSLRSIIRDYYHVNPVDFTKLEKTTSRGNPYIHNPYSTQTENGNYLWIYIQWNEMREVWNRRSEIPFDSLNKKDETVAYTIVRYLSSKGWRKDADAVEKLSRQEVSAIEKGVANYIFLEKFSIRGRVYEFLWGFDNYVKTGNPTGSTLMQRFEFWKASIGIIKDNWLTGVGTGDMNLAFSAQYEKMHTKLAPDQRWRSHNQFLSIFIGFGIFGMLWFLFSIFYPPVMSHHFKDYFFLIFMIISLLSMLTGDTIESQTGVSFFAIFYSLFLFARKEKEVVFFKDTK